MLVGARHEVGVELGGGHEAPQLLDALGGGAALGLAFEGLEHGSLFKRVAPARAIRIAAHVQLASPQRRLRSVSVDHSPMRRCWMRTKPWAA